MKGMCTDEETCTDVERLQDFSLCTGFPLCLDYCLSVDDPILALVRLPACFNDVSCSDPMNNSKWKAGDWAVYRKSKRSTTPGPRATSVKACSKGENYTYIVDKFWIVDSMLPGDRLLLRTARGKTHIIDASDPNLRKPGWLRRLLWRERFRSAEASVAENSPNFAS